VTKKNYAIIAIAFIIGVVIGGCLVYFSTNKDVVEPNNNLGENTPPNNNSEFPNENNSLNLPTEGNNTVLTTNSPTTLRVVNEYDKNFFTAEKNLLIMFASWCPNCQAEIAEIEKILNKYKNNSNVNIVLIAHEYEDTVEDLIELVEKDVNFGDAEVKIDLGRIIRRKIDPEASTIPISYVVDKSGKVLAVHNESLTLEKAIEMLEK